MTDEMHQSDESWGTVLMTPDTPDDAAGVLGRALQDQSGDLWVNTGSDAWQAPAADDSWPRADIEQRYGHTTEVLLVSPAAGRVIDAARQWARWYDHGRYGLPDSPKRRHYRVTNRALVAAVDALDADQPAEPAPDTPAGARRRAEHAAAPLRAEIAELRQHLRGCPTCSGSIRETVGMVCQTCGTDYAPPDESAPEPDDTAESGDGYEDDCLRTAQEVHARGVNRAGVCDRCGEPPAAHPKWEPDGQSTEPAWEGRALRECGEHRTTGSRAWCYDCTEWCYLGAPCTRCELPYLRVELAEMTADRDRWRAAGERYSQQREDLRSELAEVRAAAERARQQNIDRTVRHEDEVERLRGELAEATASRGRWHGHALDQRTELAGVIAERNKLRDERDRQETRAKRAEESRDGWRRYVLSGAQYWAGRHVAQVELAEVSGAFSDLSQEHRNVAAGFGTWLARELAERSSDGRIRYVATAAAMVQQWSNQVRYGAGLPDSSQPASEGGGQDG